MRRSPVLLLVVPALAVVAPVASAAVPGGASYGGGTIVDRPPGAGFSGHSGDTEMGLTTSANGTRVRIDATVLYCGRRTREANADRTVRIAPDGTFRARLVDRSRLGKRRWVTRLRVSGRIDGPRADGTVSARGGLKGRKARCRGTTTWTSVIPGEPAGPAGVPPGGSVLHGLVTSGGPTPFGIALRVSGDAGTVTRLLFETPYTCKFRRGVDEVWRRRHEVMHEEGGPIRPDGSFRIVNRFRIRYADAVERARVAVRGQFQSGGAATGTIKVSSVIRAKRTGRVVARCFSSTREWSAIP